MAAEFIGAAAQERDPALRGPPPDLGDRRLGFRTLESGEVARQILRPRDISVEKRAQQFRHRAELLRRELLGALAEPMRDVLIVDPEIAVVA